MEELKYNDDYIIGRIKNKTNKNYNLDITIQTKSGTLVNDEDCHDTIKPYETKEFKCLALDLDDTYSFKIKKIKKEDFETPKLTYGEIDESTLKYHFENIYYNYSMFIYDINYFFDKENNNSKFDLIEYNDDIIKFENTLKINEETIIMIEAQYYTKNENLKSLFVLTNNTNQETKNNIINAITLLSKNADYHIKIRLALNEIAEFGKCYLIDDFCYAQYDINNIIQYSVTNQK